MSFSGTPLGQARRLDQSTFLNKQRAPRQAASATTTTATASSSSSSLDAHVRHPTSPVRPAQPSIPTSYAYGASRSPQPKKSASAAAILDTSADAPALERFRRAKERDAHNAANPQHPAWAVTDTSVNLANALNIAANTSAASDAMDASYLHPTQRVPRSTSVDYEAERAGARQLPIRHKPASSSSARARPVQKAKSLQYVPGSDEEENAQEQAARRERGKSPLVAFGESVGGSLAEAAKKAAFYMKAPAASTNGHAPAQAQEESYNYEQEERAFEAERAQAQQQAKPRGMRRGGMSLDAKAYQPTASDQETESEAESDDGRPRRRKKKKGEPGGVSLTGLPTVGYTGQKRRKRKSAGGKEDNSASLNTLVEDEEEMDGRSEPEKVSEIMERTASVQGQPLTIHAAARAPSLRGSVPPAPAPQPFESSLDSVDDTDLHRLPPLTEALEPPFAEAEPPLTRRRKFKPLGEKKAKSLGQTLGHTVNVLLRFLMLVTKECGKLAGRFIGTTYDTLVRKPMRSIGRMNWAPLFQLLAILGAVSALYLAFRSFDPSSLFGSRYSGATPIYTAPSAPAADIAELGVRLQAIENALGKLSFEAAHERARLDAHADVGGRLDALQTQVRRDAQRAESDRAAERASASQGIAAVRGELDALKGAVREAESGRKESAAERRAREAEAARLAALEQRVGGVEGGVREALDAAKALAKAPQGDAHAPAWWTKLSSSGKALTIRGGNGEDVTALLGALVDGAVGRAQKDGLARADFALHSGGARVIPSLTSETLEAPAPRGLRQAFHALVTGANTPVGRPPVWALHPDTAAGACWPFGGARGQLGVALARPAYIDAVSVDHLARELAWSMRSAPRHMELWGLVEGADNLAKVHAWETGAALARAAGDAGAPPALEYPAELPTGAKYIRVARFEYDARAGAPVQTFPADAAVKALGVDFGVVVLRVLGNWGAEYTCLYRVRVHGEMLGAQDAQIAPDAAADDA